MFGRIAAFVSVALIGASCATKAVEKEEVVSIPVEPYVPTWKCIDCTPEEQYVLKQLQDKTRITDKNALATILGNICLLYTSPSPRDYAASRMPSSA